MTTRRQPAGAIAARAAIVAVLTVPAAVLVPQAQVARPRPETAIAGARMGTARIIGHVVDPTGAPLSGARVTLASEERELVRWTDTDGTGAFSFENLPAASYTLVARRSGFAESPFGAVRPGGAGVEIRLTDDTVIFTADVTMAAVPVVEGTILDETGRPTVAAVKAFVRQSTRGAPGLKEVTRVESGRDGRYRIEDLPPGDYLIVAERSGSAEDLTLLDDERLAAARRAIAEASAPLPAAATGRERTFTYVPVYFGGTVGSRRATPVRIDAGVVRSGIDIRLQLVRTTTLEGRLLLPAGGPLANGRIALIGEDDEVVTRYGSTTVDGQYRFVGVPAGRYAMVASTAGRLRPGQPDPPAPTFAATDLYVDPDLAVQPLLAEQPAATIAGTIVFDGATRPPDPNRVRVTLVAQGGPFAGFVWSGSGTVAFDVDGEWRLTHRAVPPGRYLVAVSGLPPSRHLRAATIAGRDVATTPFDIEPGRRIEDLVVTVTDRTTHLSGTIVDEGGRAVYTHSLVVFGVDPAGWIEQSRRVRVIRPDSRGGYEVGDLPAGEYFVALVSNLDPSDRVDAELLGRFVPGAVRVTLVEGQDVTRHLRVGR